MIDGTTGRARCARHDAEAFYTCPRCGGFVCMECRRPSSSTEALLRTVRVSVSEEGAERLCPACLARPHGRSVRGPLLGFGLLLLGLVVVVAMLART
ncbi:MAG: hypothetical protein AB1938_15040 [Myxococcota bacterium]